MKRVLTVEIEGLSSQFYGVRAVEYDEMLHGLTWSRETMEESYIRITPAQAKAILDELILARQSRNLW